MTWKIRGKQKQSRLSETKNEPRGIEFLSSSHHHQTRLRVFLSRASSK